MKIIAHVYLKKRFIAYCSVILDSHSFQIRIKQMHTLTRSYIASTTQASVSLSITKNNAFLLSVMSLMCVQFFMAFFASRSYPRFQASPSSKHQDGSETTIGYSAFIERLSRVAVFASMRSRIGCDSSSQTWHRATMLYNSTWQNLS